jgi:tripartite-type tricarboxylate transporter receptor subunit TctC
MEKKRKKATCRKIVLFPMILSLFMVGISEGLSYADEKYPSRPINMIVPWGIGGVGDLASKIVADKMSLFLGQPIISQYKPGGGGSLGASLVAKAKPDGYTIIDGNIGSFVISPIVKKVDYQFEDFIQIGMIGKSPVWIVVKTDAPWKNLKEFIEEAKGSPGKLTVSSFGKLSTADFTIELLSRQAGIKLTHVPYKSSGEAITAVLGGHAHAAFTTGAGGLVESGSVRVLALAAEERLEDLSDIPTFKECGYPIFISALHSIATPKGLSKEVIATLVNAYNKAFEAHGKEIKKTMRNIEMWAQHRGPQETFQAYKNDYDTLRKLAKELGIVAK